MRKIAALTVFAILISGINVSAQEKNPATEAYVQKYYKWAIQEMQQYGIPASITLAQGILESGNGTSELAKVGNNHFGIKCKSSWMGPRMYLDDDEAGECFRVYDNAWESYRDHSKFLAERKWYKELFDLDPKDYKAWAHGLKKCGYATLPTYAERLISLIEKYELNQFDFMEVDMLEGEEIELDEVTRATLHKEYPDIVIINNIRAIKATENLSPLDVANHYEVNLAQLYRYNEMQPGDNFTPGMNVFLQPKRSRAEIEEHVVRKGESMQEISQLYGIKLSHLYDKNLLVGTEQAAPGETLYLKKKRTEKPNTRSYMEMLKEKNQMFYKQPKPITRDQIDWKAGLDEKSIEEHAYKIKQQEGVLNQVKIKTETTTTETEKNAPVAEEIKTPEKVEEKPEPVIKPEKKPESVVEKTEKLENTDLNKKEEKPVVEAPASPSYEGLDKKKDKAEKTVSTSYDNLKPDKDSELEKGKEKVTTNYENLKTEEEKTEAVKDEIVEKENTPEPVKETPPAIKEEIKEEVKETPAVSATKYHTVIKGETLYSLSRKYEVTVDQIKTWNKLPDNTIKTGQKLIVGQ